VLWARLDRPPGITAAPVRATPIALLTREHWPLWQRLRGPDTDTDTALLSANAGAIAAYLQQHGASFFDEIMRGVGLLQSQAEGAVAELVAAGCVSADSFGGLRALLLPLERKRKLAARGRRASLGGLADAGRWSLIHRDRTATARPSPASAEQAALAESIAWVLLRRYGVVFRRLLWREASWLPPWHALLGALRRLEAQGQLRGGRFVAGVSGEQYALPEAVSALRAVRRRARDGALISLSAADPLNLAGIVTPGARIAALAGNRLLLADGVPLATLSGGEVQFLQPMSGAEQWRARNALLRQTAPAGLSQIA
jgi:ATP-dependent Lhr-like helicase